jgi:hypothetical protein
VSPSDRYYLHDTATSGISPAGEYMNATQGTAEATITFDTLGQTAYWYVDETWPTGSNEFALAAGNYTFNMYFGGGGGASWWDTNYSSRQPINISAGSSSIPSDYPVKLTLNHSDLVTNGKSQADGDDIRIAYWNGTAWSEVDRVLGNGSSWDSADTRVLFKTQASIAASGFDTDHYLYYNHSTAASPPTSTPSARYFLAESLGETQTSSTTYANKVQLQFTPGNNSEEWVIVATWRQRHVGSSGVQVFLGESQITLNGAARTGTDQLTYEMSGDVWKTFAAILKITGVDTQQTVGIDFRANGGTDGIDNARILAFMIPDPTNADVQYGENLATTTDTANPTYPLAVTFTPTSNGDYVWMVNGFHHEGPSGSNGGGLFAEDETGGDRQNSEESYLSSSSEGFVPLTHFEVRSLTTSSQTFDIRHQADVGGNDRQGLTQILFRADVFEGVETAASTGQSTTTLTTYQTKISLETALQSSDRDYVYLAVMMHDDVGSGGDLSNSDFAEWRINGTQHLEGEKAIARGTYHTQISMGFAETLPGNRTIDGRYRAEVSTVTAETQWAHVTVLRYKEPALALEAEEQQGTIEVTVYVHHTAADGTDPQEIVTSSPVTVTGATEPLIVNVGEGTEQVFQASDPRRLRLLVNVTDLTGGGSFVLAYNSSANPTSLETPVAGTRLQLINPTLAPTSGSTSTNFNFTIDYRHPDGIAANLVRGNVSDATNGTYNNFTMSPVGNPEIDYFVQESWAINGTIANFANMQSDSDAGASAILAQTVGTPDPSGFVWLDVPDEVALGATLNAWVEDQNLSDDGVPSEATGVVLGWVADTGSDQHSIARGSEDTNDYMNGGSVDCELEDLTWRMQIVKLGSNRFIDTWRESTSQRLYVMAYTIGEDPLFLTVPTDIGSLTADSSWNSITVSGLDADTDGVLMLGQVTVNDDTSILVRATGSTDSPTGREWEEYHCGWLPVKIDSNDQFEYRLTSGDTATLWLVAETKGSIDWLDANRTTISTGSSGWVTRDLDSFETVPYDATGVILQVDEGTASGCAGSGDCRVLAREEGQTWTFPEYDVGSDKLLHIGTGIDSANQFDLYQENASVMDVYTHAITRHITPGVIQFVGSGGTTGTSFSMDIGSAGTNRLVVVIADDESTGTNLTGATVDGNSCNLVARADNPTGSGNHQEMWYCDEDDLGSSADSVTIAITGGDSGWGVHAHLYVEVDQSGPTGNWTEEAAASVSTIEVELVDVPADGLVVMGAGNGESGSWTSWTSPLVERTDGPNPSSAVLGTASEVETSAQTDKTYIATASGTFNRGTGIVAVWNKIASSVSEFLGQFNTTGIRSTGVDTLVVRYNLVTGDDTFGVWIWDFTASDWIQRGTLDQTAVSFFNYTLTADEKSGGIVRIRLNDTSDIGETDLNVDYQLVNNTLWSTGVTYYVNTTLAAGEYSHFFWANDTNGVSNRTVTLSGPSVNGPPVLSDFRLENATAVSKAGEQIDVDVDHFFLFNATDPNGWSDIGDDGNVSLRLWYDGDVATTTQRDPTACDAFGNNWTSCTNGFSSNDLYAFANDSAGAAGAIAFDAVSSDNSTTSPLTFSHTIGGGSNRLLVVGIGVEGPSVGSTHVTAVTYDGVSLTQAINNTVGTGFEANAELWYMLESDLPSAGTYTISITVPSGDAFQGGAISVSDAAQQAPEATASSDDGESGDDWIETQITTITDDAWIFDAVASGNGVSYTPNSGQTERYDVLGSSSSVAGGTLAVPTAGVQTVNWTTDSSSNRITHSLAAWAPFSAPAVSGANDSAWRDFGFALGSDPISSVEVGVEWFRNNTAPILNVTASWDGGSSWATNQTATNKSADDDTVEWLDFTSATAWTPTKLNDANLRVRIGTNESGARLDYVTVRVVTTSELTYTEQTTGANYRIELKYVDTADPGNASLSEWSVTEGSATYNESASSRTPVLNGPTTIGYEFKLALRLGYQAKQANDPVNSTAGSYNDVDSWNGEVEASDGSEAAALQTASTGEHMEFGVYMYTNVSIGGDWSAAGFRGQTVNSNTITVTYRSNDDFNLTIWFTTHLVKGGDTIDISNVQILAAADANDNITSDTAFAGLGEANLVYILGSASWFFPHATDANENTTVVQFSVFLPLGQAMGTYTAQLVIKIQQKPAS